MKPSTSIQALLTMALISMSLGNAAWAGHGGGGGFSGGHGGFSGGYHGGGGGYHGGGRYHGGWGYGRGYGREYGYYGGLYGGVLIDPWVSDYTWGYDGPYPSTVAVPEYPQIYIEQGA